MINKFIETEYYGVEGVEGEQTIIKENFNLPCGVVQVLITRQKTDSNGEDYYNLYVIDDNFKKEPMNCLKEQIPVEEDKERLFSKLFLECEAIKHYLWFKYSTNEECLSFNIEVIRDE